MMNSSGCKLLHRWRQHSHSVPAPTTENPAINHAPQLHATHKSACNKLIHSTDERSGGMKESAMYANRYTIGNHSRDDGVECGLELEAVSVVQSMSIMLLDGFSLTAPAAILIWQRNSRNSSKNDRHNNNNKFTFQFDIFLHKSRFFLARDCASAPSRSRSAIRPGFTIFVVNWISGFSCFIKYLRFIQRDRMKARLRLKPKKLFLNRLETQ